VKDRPRREGLPKKGKDVGDVGNTDQSVKDRILKELVLRHFWTQRCFVQPEVDIRFGAGISADTKMITDVDVFVLRPHPDLYFERVLADCRTLRAQSPIARVLWLRGLMEFVASRTGLLLLGAATRIEQDHKLAANRIGIRLLREEEFGAYDRAVVYPEGSQRAAISLNELQSLKDLGKRFPRLEPLATYLYRDAWLEPGFGELIRHMIGHVRTASREFDPGKREHLALFCDAAAIFAIGVAECGGQVFHQYLQPRDKEALSESLKLLVWGGREQYQFYQTLRKKALELPPLDLPEWNEFLQLMRNVLERPAAAFDVPWLLRRLALDTMRGWEPMKYVRKSDVGALRLAMLTFDYLAKATGLPKDGRTQVDDILVRVQSRLAAGTPQAADIPSAMATLKEFTSETGAKGVMMDLFDPNERGSQSRGEKE
jgi:hypothetical protein